MTREYDTVKFRELLSDGTILLSRGKHLQAAEKLEAAYEMDDQNYDVNLNLAGAYILNKKFKRAQEILEKLAEQYPENAEVWQNLGAAYLGNPVLAKEEDQLRAVDAFIYALKLKPDLPHVAYNIGLIHKDRKEYPAAIEWFTVAFKTDPSDKDAIYWLTELTEKDA